MTPSADRGAWWSDCSKWWVRKNCTASSESSSAALYSLSPCLWPRKPTQGISTKGRKHTLMKWWGFHYIADPAKCLWTSAKVGIWLVSLPEAITLKQGQKNCNIESNIKWRHILKREHITKRVSYTESYVVPYPSMPTFSSAIFHLPVSKAFREEMSKCPLLLILIQYILATCSTEGSLGQQALLVGGDICFLVGPEGKNKSQYSLRRQR